MKKLIKASVLLLVLSVLQTKAFAFTMNCKFNGDIVAGVKTIAVSAESLYINGQLEIPLQKTDVKCGGFGKQIRFDGNALGYQVILRSCTSEAVLKGDLIDEVHGLAAEIQCD